MVQLGLLRVKADSAQPVTPRGPAANQQSQSAEGAAGGSAAEAAMQLSTGDPAPQKPADAQPTASNADFAMPQPAGGQQPGLANGDPGACAVHAAAAPSAADATQAVVDAAASDADAEDVDMDIDPTAGAYISRVRVFRQSVELRTAECPCSELLSAFLRAVCRAEHLVRRHHLG